MTQGKAAETSLSMTTKVVQGPIDFEAAIYGELLYITRNGESLETEYIIIHALAKPSEREAACFGESSGTLRW